MTWTWQSHVVCERCDLYFESTSECNELQVLRGDVRLLACPKCGRLVAVLVTDRLFVPVKLDDANRTSKS